MRRCFLGHGDVAIHGCSGAGCPRLLHSPDSLEPPPLGTTKPTNLLSLRYNITIYCNFSFCTIQWRGRLQVLAHNVYVSGGTIGPTLHLPSRCSAPCRMQQLSPSSSANSFSAPSLPSQGLNHLGIWAWKAAGKPKKLAKAGAAVGCSQLRWRVSGAWAQWGPPHPTLLLPHT